MNNSTLDEQSHNTSKEFQFSDISQIQNWITSLSQGDAHQTLNLLFSFVKQLNKQNLDIVLHYKVLNSLAPAIENTLETIKSPYNYESLPLSDNSQTALKIKQGFLQQLCESYKVLINKLIPVLSSHEKTINILCIAIYHSMHYSTLLLVEQYLSYMKQDNCFWKEIHRLYQLAIKYNLHQISLNAIADNSKKTHISSSYKRLILLASADPYHLMQTEILKTFDHLERWSWYAKFISKETFNNKGGLLIDFTLDIPARRVNSNSYSVENNALYLDISDIVKVSRIQMQKLTLSLNTTDELFINKTTFIERSFLSMFVRLHQVWSEAYKRNSERKSSNETILSAIGLSTCHRLISSDIEFTPEQDEINLKKGTLGGSLHLTLIPKEHTPWVEKTLEEDIRTGVVKPRESFFEEEDIWKKKRVTELSRTTEKAEKRKEIIIFDSLIRNKNAESGLSLYCQKDSGIQVHVGELISYKDKKNDTQHWHVGVVKWLNNLDSHDITLGVEQLQGDIKPIAVKAISGIGEGSEYFRALLLTDKGSQPSRSIITPSAIYDTNTILLVNVKEKLRYIRLKELIESSGYYSQFSFESTTDPELNKIDNTWV